jgi:Tol biopolymer transport system component
MLASVLVRDVDYSLLPPNLNPRIEELLRRALQKNPKRRWQAAGDIRGELEIIAAAPNGTSALPAVPPPRSLGRRAIPIVLTALISGAVVGVTAWTLKPPAPAAVTRFSVPLGEGQIFTRARSQVAAISPDGQNLVYVGNRQLYLRRLDDMELRPIPGTSQDVGSPFFSPDGRWLGFFSFQDNAIKKIAVTGGAPITLCNGCSTTLGRGMSWENGTIVFAHGSGLSIFGMPESGGKPEVWIKADSNEILSSPQLLPGGNTLMFAVSKTGTGDPRENSDIVVFRRSTNQRQVVIHGGTGGRYVSTGHIVYRLGSNLYAVPFDLQQLKTRGEPIPIIENIASEDYGPANFDFSRNGTLVYVPSSSTLIGESRREVLIADRSGKASAVPGLPPGSYTSPRVSPDGNRVALEVVDDGSISIYELSGKSQLRRLTLDSINSQPIWSPDGKRIAFRSNRGANVDAGIFVQNADGSGTAERLTTATGSVQEVPFAWHPDGLLAFTRDQRLWTIAVEGDKKIGPLTESSTGSQYNASFSPDGHWVAYTSSEPRQNGPRVFVQKFPTGARYQVTREPSDAPAWSRDGKELFYASDLGKLVSVRVQTEPSFSVGEPVVLPIELNPQRTNRLYDVLPGDRFLVMRPAPLPGGTGEHPVQQIHVVLNWFRELQERVPVK